MPGQVTGLRKPTAIPAVASRLLPLNPNVWVLALDLGGANAYVRLAPHEWMARITGVVGEEVVTADGPILRSVLLENLPVTSTG
jgi:hypothetical protein